MKAAIALDPQARRMIVSAGLAAANNGMRKEMLAVQAALGDLIETGHIRRIVEATMLIGAGQSKAAQQLLHNDTSAEARLLQHLINSEKHASR